MKAENKIIGAVVGGFAATVLGYVGMKTYSSVSHKMLEEKRQREKEKKEFMKKQQMNEMAERTQDALNKMRSELGDEACDAFEEAYKFAMESVVESMGGTL